MPKGNKYDPVRSEGLDRLRTQSQQEDAPAWRDAQGMDSQIVSGLVRRTSNMDPSDNDTIVSTTHRDPEPPMDMSDYK